MFRQFYVRGNLVTVTQERPSTGIVDHKKMRQVLDDIQLLNKLNRLAQTRPAATHHVTKSIGSTVCNIRESIRHTPRICGTIKVERSTKNKKKNKKLTILTQLYSRRMYSNTQLVKTQGFTCDSNVSLLGGIKRDVATAVSVVNSRVKMVRDFHKAPVIKQRRFTIRSIGHTVEYMLTNGCFQPGQLQQISKSVKARLVYSAKKPASMERHVAVEIECFGPESKEELGHLLSAAGLARYIELKGDGSIRPNKSTETPYELAILAPASVFREVIQRTTQVLSDAECKVNKSCGLHVHLDTRINSPYRMFSNLVSAQKILYKMQPVSRRENNMCEATPSKDLNVELRKGKRYLGINPMSYRRHGTIEVRLHSGTIDATKIINFVTILEKVAYNPVEISRAASTVKGFVKQHNIPTFLEAYINERINKFSGTSDLAQEEAS